MREKIIKELKGSGCQERAEADKKYHKSNREHWGVPVPISAEIARKYSKELDQSQLIELSKALWANNQYDSMICAGKILCLSKVEPSEELWRTLVGFLENVNGWALEDNLAHVAWKCILADETRLHQVETWTQHPNFWMRRAALVYTLPYAKPKRDPERMLKWAGGYAAENEWFIQKAIGWWLRVLGAHNPERVIQFLEEHWVNLKGVAKKEATRKLDPDTLRRLEK